MNLHLLSESFQSLLLTTLGASLLTVFAIVLRHTLKRWLPVHVFYILSTLVLLRLALPVFPESEFSWLNLTSPSTGQASIPFAATLSELSEAQTNVGQSHRHTPTSLTLVEYGALIWVAGIALLFSLYLVSYLRFRLWLNKQPLADDSKLMALVETCRKQTELRFNIAVYVVDRMRTPAVFGLFKPKILIPEDLLLELSESELKHVLLHEMSHIRRHDILAGAIALGIGAVHWFNPLVWIIVRQFSADRELLCDRAVLRALGDSKQSSRAYGSTLVRLLCLFSLPSPRSSGLAHFLGIRKEIKNRIGMIAKPNTPHRLGNALGWVAITGLAIVCFTLAAPADSDSLKDEQTTRHRNFQGEHDREHEHHYEGNAERRGNQLTPTESLDGIRNGTRLILAYDANSDSFRGTVQNVTNRSIEKVSVGIHLSNGTELPSHSAHHLKPGAVAELSIKNSSHDFNTWTAHQEISHDEHQSADTYQRKNREHHFEGEHEHR